MNTLARRTPSPPPPARALSRKSSSNGSFVCNVSDDEVIERDVDLEIEARIRSGTLPGSDSESELPVPQPRTQRSQMPRRTSGTAPASASTATKSTLSQRMLSALHRKKNQNASRTKRSGSILLEVVQAEQGAAIPEGAISDMPRSGSNHSMGADIDGLVVPDPFYDPSQDPVYMSDEENGPISHSVSSSCKDRLEARITDRLLQNKSILSSNQENQAASGQADTNDLTVVYTNRRTYPAESSKKPDPRSSDNHLETRYERAGVTAEQRVNRVSGHYYQQQYGSQQYSNQPTPPAQQQQHHHQKQPHPHMNFRGPIEPTIEVLDSNKSLPVAFHFQGQNGSVQAPTPSRSAADHRPHDVPTRASPLQTREPTRREDPYAMLVQSVTQIQQVVDGLENCLMASSFASLAMVALRELELLRDSTQQIRTNGTTRILAEVAQPQSQMLGPYRQLVAHAVSLQHRIEGLIHHIRTTC